MFRHLRQESAMQCLLVRSNRDRQLKLLAKTDLTNIRSIVPSNRNRLCTNTSIKSVLSILPERRFHRHTRQTMDSFLRYRSRLERSLLCSSILFFRLCQNVQHHSRMYRLRLQYCPQHLLPQKPNDPCQWTTNQSMSRHYPW